MKRSVLLSLVLLLSGCGVETGRGSRVGTIIKAADEGIIFTTHEIEIVRGGMQGGSGGFSVAPFYATVTDDNEWQIVQKFYNEQKEVRVQYVSIWWAPTASECTDGCHFVTSVVPADSQ